MTMANMKEREKDKTGSDCEGYHTSFVMEPIPCNTGCAGAKIGFLLPSTSMSFSPMHE